jgi:cell division protein FtsZ
VPATVGAVAPNGASANGHHAPHAAGADDDQPAVATSEPSTPQPAAPREPAGRPPRGMTFDEGDDLDVPDFLK